MTGSLAGTYDMNKYGTGQRPGRVQWFWRVQGPGKGRSLGGCRSLGTGVWEVAVCVCEGTARQEPDMVQEPDW